MVSSAVVYFINPDIDEVVCLLEDDFNVEIRLHKPIGRTLHLGDVVGIEHVGDAANGKLWEPR